MKIDFEQEGLNAYASAITRLRWFLLTTTVLSSLLILKVYLERWSFADQQLETVIANRIIYQIPTKQELKKKQLDSLFQSSIYPLDINAQDKRKRDIAEAKEFAQLDYIQRRTDHTLNDMKLEDLEIPLLGVSIPDADYFPIISVMLTLFTLGVWLSVRSVSVSAQELLAKKHGENEVGQAELARLLRLRFTFTWVEENNSCPPSGLTIARLLEHSAYWLPLAAMIFGTWFDLYPILEWSGSQEVVVGPTDAIVIRVVILCWCIVVIALSCLSTSRLAGRTNAIISEKGTTVP